MPPALLPSRPSILISGTRRAWRRDGFTGMLAIHPIQVAVINAAFLPTPEELAHARRVVAAFAQASQAGAVQLDGKMLDAPHLAGAKRLLDAAAKTGNPQ